MLKYLKVNIKSLTAEARIIRREEQKLDAYMDLLAHKGGYSKTDGDGGTVFVKTKKHAKGEDKPVQRTNWPEIENPQEKIDAAWVEFWGLQNHRKVQLRREARISFLAYAFLRGVPFEKVEVGSYDFPDLKAIEVKARRFAGEEIGDNAFKAGFSHWADKAKKYWDEKGNLNPKAVEKGKEKAKAKAEAKATSS